MRQLEPVTLLNVRVLDYLACPNCGNPLPRRAGKCCDGACRVALHRWRQSQGCTLQERYNTREIQAQQREAVKRRRPVEWVGRRSTLALRSPNLPHGEIIEDEKLF